MEQLIYNAIIFNRGKRFHGHLVIEERRIKSVREGVPTKTQIELFGENAIDLQGHWLLPGVIDSHVHFREPGLTNKADIYSESRAAIAGGVTSFLEMPNTRPQTLTVSEVEKKIKRAKATSLANYAFFIGASSDNIEELKHADYSRIPGIKLFLGSSTGNMCVNDEKVLDEIFSLPNLIAVHCEDEKIITNNTQEIKELYGNRPIPVAWHPVVRSELACFKSTKSAVDRAIRLGTRLHICHITTDEELVYASGHANISTEACIPHLWFTDEDYDKKGSFIKCNPAIKSRRHRKALREGLTTTGAIKVVSTDHAPHTFEEKEGDLLTAPSGMPMIQFSLRVMLKLAEEGHLSVEQVVSLMSHNQADTFGIKDRGYIEEGFYADLVEIDPQGSNKPIDYNDVISKCGWTPLIGETLPASVERVWVNGTLAYKDRTFSDTSPAMPLSFKNIR